MEDDLYFEVAQEKENLHQYKCFIEKAGYNGLSSYHARND
jgi:hypothetical protein